jgi:hypothetical protein
MTILYTSREEKRGIDSHGSGSKSEKDQAQNIFQIKWYNYRNHSNGTTIETTRDHLKYLVGIYSIAVIFCYNNCYIYQFF